MDDRRVLARLCDLFYRLLIWYGRFAPAGAEQSGPSRWPGRGTCRQEGRWPPGCRYQVARDRRSSPGRRSWPQLLSRCDHQPDSKRTRGGGRKNAQTIEQGRQHDLLMTCGLYVLPRICISVGPPNGSIHARNGAAHPSNGLVSTYRHQDSAASCLRRVWRCPVG